MAGRIVLTKVFVTKVFVLGFLLAAVFFLFAPGKANAADLDGNIGGVYPRGGARIVLSKYIKELAGSHLEAPESTIRVFYNLDNIANSNNLSLRLEIICGDPPKQPGQTGGTQPILPDARYYIGGGDGKTDKRFVGSTTQCYPAPDIVVGFSKSELQQDARYPSNFRYIDLFMELKNRTTQDVKLRIHSYDGLGKVTLKELNPDVISAAFGQSNNYTNNEQTQPRRGTYGPLDGQSVSISTAGLPDALNDFVSRFQTDCTVTTNTTMYLRWHDADVGDIAKNQRDGRAPDPKVPPLRIVLNGNIIGQNNYANGSPDNSAGDNDSYRERRMTAVPGRSYTWTWEDLESSNGITVWTPISEITQDPEFVRAKQAGKCGCVGDCPPDDGTASCRANINQASSNIPVELRSDKNAVDTNRWFNIDLEFTNTTKQAFPLSGPNALVMSFPNPQYGNPDNPLPPGNIGYWFWGHNPPPGSSGNYPSFSLHKADGSTVVLFPGETAYGTATLLAPPYRGSPGNPTNIQKIMFYANQHGKVRGTDYCPVSPNIYEKFKFNTSANVTMTPDNESPTNIKFTAAVNKEYGPDVPGKATVTSTKNGNLVQPPIVDSRTFGSNGSYEQNINPNPYKVGDRYCARIDFDYGEGWYGPYDNFLGQVPYSSEGCNIVVNHPYVRAYGADVLAGGGFGACNVDGTAGIRAYFRPLREQVAGGTSGSGAQLAAFALSTISGFTSASIRDNDPTLPKGLTFAHDNSTPDQNSFRASLGGSMSSGGTNLCLPDYFETTQFPAGHPQREPDSDSNTFELGNPLLPSGKQTVIKPAGGTVNLSGVSSFSKRHSVYVDGDVFITSNIAYNTIYAQGINSIPNFALIVKGNIYISNNVTRLDGLYIAQPEDGSKGRIYTCAVGGKPITDPAGMWSQCGGDPPRQLVVNGAFLADRIILNRTFKSLRDSKFREKAGDSNAAEIFNFSPELYLSNPVFRQSSTLTSGEYDYITTLPPIL